MALTTVNPGLLDSQAQYTGFKNRIINGQMQIDQRNAGAAKSCPASTVTYTLDRWLVYPVGNAVSVQQVASGLSTGSPNAIQATGASSVTNIILAQRIESKNIVDCVGQTVTVSVTMANSLLTSISWLAEYANTADNFANTTSIASGTITVNSTMTTYSFSFTVPANGANGISISLTAGAQTSGTWKVTQVQLEKGSTATSFDYRPYGTELALCQRYYFKVTAAGYYPSLGVGRTTDLTRNAIAFPVPMRIPPTSMYTTGVASDYSLIGNSAPECTSVPTLNNVTPIGGVIGCTATGSITVGYAYLLSNNNAINFSYLAWSAEL